MPSLYFIQSAANGLGLNVNGANSAPGTAVITWPWQGGATNALWAIHDDGSIVSALGSNLYLAPSPTGNGLIISDQSYYWTFSGDGPITNQDGAALTEGSGQGDPVTLGPLQPGAMTQSWWAAPNIPIPPQNFTAKRYIASDVSDPDGSTFVLNVSGDTDAPGTNIILWQLQPNSLNSLWQMTSDGRILSMLDPSLLIGLLDSSGGPLVTQSASPTGNDPHWSMGSSGQINDPKQINNVETGLYLGIDGNPATLWPGAGPNAVATTIDGSSPKSTLWYLVPNNLLNTIIMQNPARFPSFVGEQAAAFCYINEALGIANIRTEYANLSVSLSDWQTTINTLSAPAGVDPTSWTDVVSQINAEINAADSVRDFFQQFEIYLNTLNQLGSDIVNQLGTLAGLEQGSSTSVGGLLLSIFEGLAYTVLSALPGPGPVIGNIMEMAVNIATTATNVKTPISPDPFKMAYADLWGSIAASYQSAFDASGLMQTTLLSDWGKMETFYAAATKGGLNSLSWPADQTAEFIDNSKPSFEVSVLQMLLPAKFQIYFYLDCNGNSIDNVPDEAQWICWSSQGQWMKYWIADQENWKAYPVTHLLNSHVWGNNVSKADFFLSRNGWGFASAFWQSETGPLAPPINSDYLVVTINNQTPNVLTLSTNVTEGQNIGFISETGIESTKNSTLQPYSSAAHLSSYSGGLVDIITVSDGTGKNIASFTLHMHQSGFKAGDVWEDSDSWSSDGYNLSNAICNQGSVGDGYTGVAQITISYSSS